ncbi:MAG TPA: hypothetical protein VEA69_03825 [Tepidisphaeraceae bacterium]|nr:hypothetical protein [Tepidisphaeraceae bacterium]
MPPEYPAGTRGVEPRAGRARAALTGVLARIRRLALRLVGTNDSVEARRLKLQQLRVEYERLGRPSPGDPHADVRDRIHKLLNAERADADAECGARLALDLAEVEARLVSLLPGYALARWDWRLRQEFKRLATSDLYEAYVNSKPPSPDDAARGEDDRLRVAADAAYLVDEIQRLRLGRSRVEAVRSYFAFITLALTAAAVGVVVKFWRFDETSRAIVLVPMVGLFGSFFSLISRLFAIPIKGDLFDGSSGAARRIMWGLTPLISAAQGVIAALVVYLILMAGMDEVSNTVFPKFVSKEAVAARNEERRKAAPPLPPERNFPAEPDSPTDAAKLYVFCFLAGFSERLVPDVLSQMAKKARARASSEP